MVNTWPGWETERLIGEGSFGKVYKIRKVEFGQTYEAALKVITIPASQSDVRAAFDEGMDEQSVTQYFRGFVEDIVAEFALMSQMKGNSNIVSYEDHMVREKEDEIGWDILIRMELLTPIQDYSQRYPLTEKDVIRLGIDMCTALELCRNRNIIHRDIKPENIFVSRDGNFKLGDFGVARAAEKTISVMSRKGTYGYMAPEVYKGEQYGYTVDIYSLGMVLYRYMNDNRTPYLPAYPAPISYSDRTKSLEMRMSGAEMPAPAHGSDALKAIILKACAFDPKNRFENATQMKEALLALQRGEVIKTSEESEEEDDLDATVGFWNKKPFAKEVKTVERAEKETEATVTEEEAVEIEVVVPAKCDEEADELDATVGIWNKKAVNKTTTIPDEENDKKTKKTVKNNVWLPIGLTAVILFVALAIYSCTNYVNINSSYWEVRWFDRYYNAQVDTYVDTMLINTVMYVLISEAPYIGSAMLWKIKGKKGKIIWGFWNLLMAICSPMILLYFGNIYLNIIADISYAILTLIEVTLITSLIIKIYKKLAVDSEEIQNIPDGNENQKSRKYNLGTPIELTTMIILVSLTIYTTWESELWWFDFFEFLEDSSLRIMIGHTVIYALVFEAPFVGSIMLWNSEHQKKNILLAFWNLLVAICAPLSVMSLLYMVLNITENIMYAVATVIEVALITALIVIICKKFKFKKRGNRI